ncbi:MAG TPA: histidine phosphatase family protein [Solirubrobacteraceae bacterium]|nr:histidine phosphatase family protein [Solirubrobacteraceae bacterium]
MGERRLLLLRHAKSSWDDPALPDHDRPLAARGRKAAKLIGEHIRQQGVPVALVLCSSARRARETVELVDPPGAIQVERELYAASADQLLERLRRLSSDMEVVMLVGHNPAIQELAVALTQGSSDLAGRKFPTAALATLSVPGPWQTLSPGQTGLVAFVTPKQLA